MATKTIVNSERVTQIISKNRVYGISAPKYIKNIEVNYTKIV